MIFICERTSTYGDSKPCEEAYEMKVEYKIFIGEADSKNVKKWIVEFSNLEELMDFMAKHDRVILEDSSNFILNDMYMPYIEIYDDYRE